MRWADWKRNDPSSSLSLFETAKKQEQQQKQVEEKKKVEKPRHPPPEPIRPNPAKLPNVVEDDTIKDNETAPRFGQGFKIFRPITPDRIGGEEQDLSDNNGHNDDEAGRILDDEQNDNRNRHRSSNQ
jgi:hypothetical protein